MHNNCIGIGTLVVYLWIVEDTTNADTVSTY